MKRKTIPWLGIMLGGTFILGGILSVTSDEALLWRGGLVAPWFGWIAITGGIAVLVLAYRSFSEGTWGRPMYTTEEIDKAKIEMDALYLEKDKSSENSNLNE